MFKKFLININIVLIVLIIIYTIIFAKKYIIVVKAFFKKNENINFIQGKIINKSTYHDKELQNFKIQNVLGIKKTVYSYQWKEKNTKDGIKYFKVWSKKFINHNNFIDKTKINFDFKNKYTSCIKLYNINTINNINVDLNLIKKINFDPVDIKYSNDFKNDFESKEIKTIDNKKIQSKDLDEYVYGNIKIEKENFKLIDKNIIVNSINYKEPKIGDIKIVYEYFSPNYVFIINNKNKQNIFFTNKRFLDNKSKLIKFITIFILIFYINIIYCFNLFIYKNIKIYCKNFILNTIPFLNEYFIFSSSYICAFLTTLIIISIIFNIYLLLLITTLFIIFLRNRDYYSI